MYKTKPPNKYKKPPTSHINTKLGIVELFWNATRKIKPAIMYKTPDTTVDITNVSLDDITYALYCFFGELFLNHGF